MTISDSVCRALAEILTSRLGPVETAGKIGEHFSAIAAAMPKGVDLPDGVHTALQRPATLGLIELDHAAAQLCRSALSFENVDLHLASLVVLLTKLGGMETRQLTAQYFISALSPSWTGYPALEPLSAEDAADTEMAGPNELIVVVSEQEVASDGPLFAACRLTQGAYKAFRSAEDAVANMGQTEPQFAFACEWAHASERSWRRSQGVVCDMPATTPAGRFFKARLIGYLTRDEPLGGKEDAGLARLSESLDQDLKHAQRRGGSPLG